MRRPLPIFAGFFLVSGWVAAIAQDQYADLPYPGDRQTSLYAGLRGSVAFRSNDNATIPANPPAPSTPVALRGAHDVGFGGALVVGAHLPLGFKAELEGVYRHRPYQFLSLNGAVTPAAGFRDVVAPMANLVWELPVAEQIGLPVRPFIGGGAGMAYTRTRLNDNPVGTNTYLQTSGWRFAYQALAGVKFDVAPGARLTAMYRYFQTDDVRSRCGVAGIPTLSCISNNVDQSADLGLELDL